MRVLMATAGVFDLVLSNPSAVTLYKLSPAKYAAAIGCSN